METSILSSPLGENLAAIPATDRFYRLTEAEIVHFRECKYRPSVVNIYCYIKACDPFGQGLRILTHQIAAKLHYNHRTVSRAIKFLIKAGELALEIVESHVKIVAESVRSAAEIVSQLGQTIRQPESPVTPLAPSAPIPAAGTTTTKKSGLSPIGDILPKMEMNDLVIKTPHWFQEIEGKLAVLNIKLADVLHALKKYPIVAIEAAIAHTQKQTWAEAKAGVFVNFLKKWTPNSQAVAKTPMPTPQRVKTALMEEFPNLTQTLSQEENPIDRKTLDYLYRLEQSGCIYRTQYSTLHNFFGVFLTQKDYPHPIPWWEVVTELRTKYPEFI
jgi:hypothetical protein